MGSAGALLVRYHVFIDGCRDTTRAGMEILAASLGQRYGMSPPAVMRRLQEGRFCARASLDLASAQRLVGELETLGAHASIVRDGKPETGAPGQVGASSPRYESGLAAAFADGRLRETLNLDLSGLTAATGDGQQEDTDGGWELAHVDGSEQTAADEPPARAAAARVRAASAHADAARAPTSPAAQDSTASAAAAVTVRFAGVPSALPPPAPASSGVTFAEPGPAARASSAHAVDAPALDPFLPPDAHRTDLPELADLPAAARRPSIPPPPAAAPPAAPTLSLKRAVSLWRGSSSRRSLLARLREAVAGSARLRFAAGVAVAFLVGLVPAEIYALSRAGSAYDDIRADLQADYRAADTPEKWATLEVARADAADLARSRRRRLAVSSCLLWLAVGGGSAFAWFRLIPDRSAPRAPRPRASAR